MKRKTGDALMERKSAGNRWASGAEGFTLIELLIGICILSFGLLAIGTIVFLACARGVAVKAETS
jgi:prepilin-type N-terminal cleavage/methylation domain-containing protein